MDTLIPQRDAGDTSWPAGRAVDSLIAARLLDPARRQEAVDVVAGSLAPSGPVRGPAATGGLSSVVEVLAYLGAALVLAAGSLFSVTFWEELDFGGQVAVLAIMAAVLGAAGVLTARGHAPAMRQRAGATDVRRRLASTLLTASALAAAGLVGLVVDRVVGTPDYYDPATIDWTLAGASATGLVIALVGRRLADSAVGVLGSFVAVTTLVTASVEPYSGDSGLLHCLVILALALVWLLLTELVDRHAPTLGRVLGAALALYAVQVPVFQGSFDGGPGLAWVGYLLTAMLAVVGTVVYLRLAAWPYLAVAVLAVTIVVPEAVSDWTGGGLGAIGGVLLTGVTLLLASGVAARLHQRR